MITKPVTLPPGASAIPTLSLDTPPSPPSPSLEPKALPQPMAEPQVPNPGAPSQMLQPAPMPPPPPPPPEPPPGPQPKWVNEGKYNIWRTVAAAGTVAALAGLGFVFLKK